MKIKALEQSEGVRSIFVMKRTTRVRNGLAFALLLCSTVFKWYSIAVISSGQFRCQLGQPGRSIDSLLSHTHTDTLVRMYGYQPAAHVRRTDRDKKRKVHSCNLIRNLTNANSGFTIGSATMNYDSSGRWIEEPERLLLVE